MSLFVAFAQLAERVTMVELDNRVAAVWNTIINDEGGAEWLATRIADFDFNTESLDDVLQRVPSTQRELAFTTLLRNRVNRSGILARRAGRLKNGETLADGTTKGPLARWYPETLRRRILNIAAIRDRITFIEGNRLEMLHDGVGGPNTVYFLDPPYVIGGNQLYTHHQLDHELLFDVTATLSGDFLMTYHDTPLILALAQKYDFRAEQIPVRTAHHRWKKELIIGRDLTWLNHIPSSGR